MKPIEQDSGRVFELTGGSLSLDFANTVGGNREGAAREDLHSYADLVSWSRQVGIISPERAHHLMEEAARHPKRAAAALKRARELREAIYWIWVSIVRRGAPTDENLSVLNSVLAEALGQQRVVRMGGRLSLAWPERDALDSILWP